MPNESLNAALYHFPLQNRSSPMKVIKSYINWNVDDIKASFEPFPT